jgi:hypothetical protein
MTQDIEHDARSEEPLVSRIPHAVWVNRPEPEGLDGSRAVRGALGALVAVGILTMAIANSVATTPAAPSGATGYLPAQLSPEALRSPEEQPPTF